MKKRLEQTNRSSRGNAAGTHATPRNGCTNNGDAKKTRVRALLRDELLRQDLMRWKSSFEVQLDGQKKPLTKEFPLVGGGQYGARGTLLISSFLANLQIEITYPSNAPLPTKETSNNKWKGTVTLTSGSLIGSLSAEGCRQTPSLYNIKGTYSLKVLNGTLMLDVKNVTIV